MLKKIIKITICVLLLSGILLAVWAFFVEPNQLFVTNYNLKVKNWSPKLNNFKIVAISDIHAGSNFIDEAKIRRIVELANAQNPDLIVLLGDYVAEQHFNRAELKMPLETAAENLKGLQAKYGVYAILGNHDEEYNAQLVRVALEKDGYRVLKNEAVSIQTENEKLRLLGVTDSSKITNWGEANKATIAALDKLESKEGKIIILTHNPDALACTTGELPISPDAVLFLAGHTHGGQVRLPFIGTPVVPTNFKQKYVSGFVRDRRIDIFVTPGIGTSIMPIRFDVPPEISVLNIDAE